MSWDLPPEARAGASGSCYLSSDVGAGPSSGYALLQQALGQFESIHDLRTKRHRVERAGLSATRDHGTSAGTAPPASRRTRPAATGARAPGRGARAQLPRPLQPDTLNQDRATSASPGAVRCPREAVSAGAVRPASLNTSIVFSHRACAHEQQLVRTLVEGIVVDVDEARVEVVLVIHSRGGHHMEGSCRKNRCPANLRSEPQTTLTLSSVTWRALGLMRTPPPS